MTFRESGKNGSTCVTLIAYILCNDQVNEFFWYLKQKSRILLHFAHQTGIIRFLLLFEQHDVKILITSFWDTQ